MSLRVLLGCYEVPGYGGAATASYRLFEKMQQDGLDIAYLNIISEDDADYLLYRFGKSFGNPRHLANVSNCVLEEILFSPHPALADLIKQLAPDVLVADSFIAALLMKQAAPERRLIFMMAGLSQVTEYLARRRRTTPFTFGEFLRCARGGLKVFHPREREAMEVSDLIIPHSDMIRDLTAELFPMQHGKIYSKVIWRAEWIVEDALPYTVLARPFIERDIDLIFVASSWLRPEKNLPLLRQIVARCRNLRIHIVGEIGGPLPGAQCQGLVTDREQMFGLLGRSKTIVSPSQFDAAPGILWEASVMGCNVIASPNCGNWMLCHKALVAHPASPDVFVNKIGMSLEKKFTDNLQFFLDANCYADLVETITTDVSI